MNIMNFTDEKVVNHNNDTLAYNNAIENKREQLKKSLKQLDRLEKVKPVWSVVQQMDKASVPTKTIGVYKIIYKPNGKVMSIGQGNVSGRRTRHLSVFKNKGRDIIHSGGSTSGSVVGQKMYRYDDNLNNWLFSFCDCKEKTLASQFEYELQHQILPEFNGLHMGGNN